jgi:hypothetical protein
MALFFRQIPKHLRNPGRIVSPTLAAPVAAKAEPVRSRPQTQRVPSTPACVLAVDNSSLAASAGHPAPPCGS